MDNNLKLAAYVGTYTGGESKGIHRFIMDAKTGEISAAELKAELGNPTYLAIDKNNKYLYSVGKINEEGGAAAYSIDNFSGNLELINYRVSKGSSPCHISLNSKDTYVFTANYHRGTAEVYPIREDGGIGSVSSAAAHEGSGPNKERQEKPHVHFAALTPNEKYLCTIDLGIDKMVVYSVNNGILERCEELSVSFNPGCGPRHMIFHPNGKYAYIMTELSSEVIVLEYSSINNNFKIIQYISTLPENYKGENLGSAIYVSQDGSYLYASNRGHDSIAVFKIDNSTGRLEFVSHTSTEGQHPRDFAIDPTGNFILVANKDSNNIVPFKIDKATGKLERTGNIIAVPNPVCIKFLHI